MLSDVLLDALIDSLKLLPYLLVTFLILEFIEHKLSKKSQELLLGQKKIGPLIGGFLGALPQCGFGAMAANLFSSRVITIGTLIAIFLSTSDEMLPIMLSENVDFLVLLKIVAFKVFVGVLIGFLVDFCYAKFAKKKVKKNRITEICAHDHCGCEEKGLFLSALKHTLKTALFVLIANVLIGIVIFYVGEGNLANLLLERNVLTYFLASLVGLIPNCAPSVVITELYLSNLISLGTLLSGLLTGSGVGVLLLFKNNKNMKQNALILGIIYFVGVLVGFLTDCLGGF